ncbi:hypothetical protein M407DRAFT_241442 [Tulasnella calospora MUT 4182]|uniref:Uncharacterized protein n=1 Tax=Tulasnella calospora MUT 4182 TaxID=1051891 RepID=A0A0C3QUY4_9AGAM|nr:hypothetical protein M407DRAFT_241442 [Tulasnella calospora MUT 4182]
MHLSRYRRFVGLDVRNLFQQDLQDRVRKRNTWFSCTRDVIFVDLQGELFSRFLHSSSVAILTETGPAPPVSPSET